MRQVAVTEGDKVEAQIRFGVEVNGYGIGELVERIRDVTDAEIDRLVAEYDQQYAMASSLRSGGEHRESLRYAARTELALRAFLDAGGFRAFTDTFRRPRRARATARPGRAAADGRRLRLRRRGRLEDGRAGAGDEGHGGRAASGGTSFMEDYTYHLDPRGPKVLGAHMLEICPSLAGGSAFVRNPPAGHRRQERSRAAGLHRAGGPRRERRA